MGIWLILYGLDKTAEDEYLEWFHDVHIPEKLASRVTIGLRTTGCSIVMRETQCLNT